MRSAAVCVIQAENKSKQAGLEHLDILREENKYILLRRGVFAKAKKGSPKNTWERTIPKDMKRRDVREEIANYRNN